MTEPQNETRGAIPAEQRQAIIDEEQLRLLALGYVVSAVLSALFSLFGLLYLGMGLLMQTAISAMPASAGAHNQPPPAAFFWIFGIFGFLMFAFSVAIAALQFRTAWCLKRRRGKMLCTISAAISCLFIPYGTLLGVFSFIVLGRKSVVALFEGEGA
jgi:hypothetical protein